MADDGPGTPAEQRETIFGIGKRPDEKMPGSGLGLNSGLAIARDLVTLYGGRLRIALLKSNDIGLKRNMGRSGSDQATLFRFRPLEVLDE